MAASALADEDAKLSTHSGPGIRAATVRGAIAGHVPSEAKKLIVLGQCYGGDVAEELLSLPNTTVISATTIGQEAAFGGYSDDAARALKPGAGRTAADVHAAGSAGRRDIYDDPDLARIWDEIPSFGGDCPPDQFPLDPVQANGAIQSRHVIYFAGKPDELDVPLVTDPTTGITTVQKGAPKTTVRDVDDRDAIKSNFMNDAVVRTAGGAPDPMDPAVGQNGWDYSGTVEGFGRAVIEAGDAIRNSADPSKEQFILFVGDHGEGTRADSQGFQDVTSLSTAMVSSGFQTFAGDDARVAHMLNDPDNEPAFGVFLSYEGLPPKAIPPSGEIFPAFNFLIAFEQNGQFVTDFFVYEQQAADLDEDGFVGTFPGEGVTLQFPVAESELVQSMLGQSFDIFLTNFTPDTVRVAELELTTGAIRRLGFPPPGFELLPVGPLVPLAAVLGLGGSGILALRARSRARSRRACTTLFSSPSQRSNVTPRR